MKIKAFVLGAVLTLSSTLHATSATEPLSTVVAPKPLRQFVINFDDNPMHDALLATALGLRMKMSMTQKDFDATQITYYTLEGLAGIVRANASRFGTFASYFEDKDAVYQNFERLQAGKADLKASLTVLSDADQCTLFVQGVVEKDLPSLLKKMNVTDPVDQQTVALLGEIFTPVFATTLNTAYVSLQSFTKVVPNGCCCQQ